jgi:hypothetical protein
MRVIEGERVGFKQKFHESATLLQLDDLAI